MSITIDEDGAVQQWTAVYWRYHSKYEKQCDSFDMAYRFLMNGEDEGEMSSVAILGPDGATLMDADALSDAYIHSVDVAEMQAKVSGPSAITSGAAVPPAGAS